MYIYGMPVCEKNDSYANVDANLNKSNILSVFKAVVSKQEVRNEFETLLYAEAQKNPHILEEENQIRVTQAWIDSCMDCMPNEIAQRIIEDKDVIALVMENLTKPTVEEIKLKNQCKQRKFFKSLAKANDTIFDHAFYNAGIFNASLLNEAVAVVRHRDPVEVANNFFKKG